MPAPGDRDACKNRVYLVNRLTQVTRFNKVSWVTRVNMLHCRADRTADVQTADAASSYPKSMSRSASRPRLTSAQKARRERKWQAGLGIGALCLLAGVGLAYALQQQPNATAEPRDVKVKAATGDVFEGTLVIDQVVAVSPEEYAAVAPFSSDVTDVDAYRFTWTATLQDAGEWPSADTKTFSDSDWVADGASRKWRSVDAAADGGTRDCPALDYDQLRASGSLRGCNIVAVDSNVTIDEIEFTQAWATRGYRSAPHHYEIGWKP